MSRKCRVLYYVENVEEMTYLGAHKGSSCQNGHDQTQTKFGKIGHPRCSNCAMLSDRKFNEDFKNVLKIVIRALQVGFTNDLVADCPFNRHLYSLNFDRTFLPDSTVFYCFF